MRADLLLGHGAPVVPVSSLEDAVHVTNVHILPGTCQLYLQQPQQLRIVMYLSALFVEQSWASKQVKCNKTSMCMTVDYTLGVAMCIIQYISINVTEENAILLLHCL